MTTIGANGPDAAVCTTPCGEEGEIAKDADAACAVGYPMVASPTAAAEGRGGTDAEGKGVVALVARTPHAHRRRDTGAGSWPFRGGGPHVAARRRGACTSAHGRCSRFGSQRSMRRASEGSCTRARANGVFERVGAGSPACARACGPEVNPTSPHRTIAGHFVQDREPHSSAWPVFRRMRPVHSIVRHRAAFSRQRSWNTFRPILNTQRAPHLSLQAV